MNDAALQSIALVTETHLMGCNSSVYYGLDAMAYVTTRRRICFRKKVMHKPKSSAWFGWRRERVSEKRGFQDQQVWQRCMVWEKKCLHTYEQQNKIIVVSLKHVRTTRNCNKLLRLTFCSQCPSAEQVLTTILLSCLGSGYCTRSVLVLSSSGVSRWVR